MSERERRKKKKPNAQAERVGATANTWNGWNEVVV